MQITEPGDRKMKNNIKLLIAIACLVCYATDRIMASEVYYDPETSSSESSGTDSTDPWGTGDQDNTQGSWVNGEWVEGTYGSDESIQNAINDLTADSTDPSTSSTAQTAVVTNSTNNEAISSVNFTNTESTSTASDEEQVNNERVSEILTENFGMGITEENATIEQKTAAITQLLSETAKANTTSSTPFLDAIVKFFNAIGTWFTNLGTGLTEIFAPQNVTNSSIFTDFKAALQQELVNVPDLSDARMADLQVAVIDPYYLGNDSTAVLTNVANAMIVLGIDSAEFTETDIDNAMADKSLQKASLNQVIDAENTGVNIANNIQTAKTVLINYLETTQASQTSTTQQATTPQATTLNSAGGFSLQI